MAKSDRPLTPNGRTIGIDKRTGKLQFLLTARLPISNHEHAAKEYVWDEKLTRLNTLFGNKKRNDSEAVQKAIDFTLGSLRPAQTAESKQDQELYGLKEIVRYTEVPSRLLAHLSDSSQI